MKEVNLEVRGEKKNNPCLRENKDFSRGEKGRKTVRENNVLKENTGLKKQAMKGSFDVLLE